MSLFFPLNTLIRNIHLDSGVQTLNTYLLGSRSKKKNVVLMHACDEGICRRGKEVLSLYKEEV